MHQFLLGSHAICMFYVQRQAERDIKVDVSWTTIGVEPEASYHHFTVISVACILAEIQIVL